MNKIILVFTSFVAVFLVSPVTLLNAQPYSYDGYRDPNQALAYSPVQYPGMPVPQTGVTPTVGEQAPAATPLTASVCSTGRNESTRLTAQAGDLRGGVRGSGGDH